jgi:hypothetical protein
MVSCTVARLVIEGESGEEEMIVFNALLQDEEISPAEVKLARHTLSKKYKGRPSPYELWLAGDGRLELYQRIQRKNRFDGFDFIATFVATPLNETLFVGLFENCGVGTAENGLCDPISGDDAGGKFLYDLRESDRLIEYRGRLVVDWGDGYISWHQEARKHDKSIIEIKRDTGEPEFPGFLDFRARLSGLASVPKSWRVALSSVSGVYILVCPETGKQYVGAAHGEGGFWARWENYVSSGHGGNIGMKDLPARDYRVSVLEVASSSAGSEQIIGMENRWKETLMTREFGLNKN